MKKYLEVGKIVSAHGVAGELKVYPWCDSPDVLAKIKLIYFDAEGGSPMKCSFRSQNQMALVKLDGVNNVESARRFINRVIFLPREEIPIEEGSYFIVDLIGLRAVDNDTGEELGTLFEVTPAGASDIYHIRKPDGGVALVPSVAEFIKGVDLEKGEIRIRVIRGLIEEDDEI